MRSSRLHEPLQKHVDAPESPKKVVLAGWHNFCNRNLALTSADDVNLVTNHHIPILVAMPLPDCMGVVHHIQDSHSVAGLRPTTEEKA